MNIEFPVKYDELSFPFYVNSTVVGSIGGTEITVSDVARVPALERMNVNYVGPSGIGKSQLASDIFRHWYGGSGLKIEGSNDFKIEDLLTKMNLSKLAHALQNPDDKVSSQDLSELAGEFIAGKCFWVDEFNRCHASVQNQFFSLLLGTFNFKGRDIPLGIEGYSIAIGTSNPETKEYTGTFQADRGIVQRWELILDLHYWYPRDEDQDMLDERADPHVKLAPIRDISDKIVETYKHVQSLDRADGDYLFKDPSKKWDFMVLQRYFTRVLDYCKTHADARNSKRVLNSDWPTACQTCDLKDQACGVVSPMVERTRQTMHKLARGLQYLARMKRPETADDPANALLLAFKLIAPYSGLLSPNYLLQPENRHNASHAAVHATQLVEDDLNGLITSGPYLEAVGRALQGELHVPKKVKAKNVKDDGTSEDVIQEFLVMDSLDVRLTPLRKVLENLDREVLAVKNAPPDLGPPVLNAAVNAQAQGAQVTEPEQATSSAKAKGKPKAK